MTNFLPERIITGEQIKGARAMLRLDQRQFATLTHISVGMVRRMEKTQGPVTAATGITQAICNALNAAGVKLIDAGNYKGVGGPGLRFVGVPVAPDDVIDLETVIEERDMDEQPMPDAP